jgi:uncharacterized membrane protein YbaN (DUF454 family)
VAARRALYVALGSVSAGVGLVAVFVPGLPTTVFLLVALWFFTKSSPRMEAWLRGHRILGPYLRDWERERAVPRVVKWVAGLAMASTVVAAWVVLRAHPLVVVALGVTLSVVFAWIVRRPEPARAG